MGALSEVSVSSYNWIESPQKSEKLFSICVVPPSHRSFLNASWIMPTYVALRPVPAGFASPPSTLSVGETVCPLSGIRPIIFRPSSGNERPVHDTSGPLFGGPTAWEAALELGRSAFTAEVAHPTDVKTPRLAA